MVSPLRCIVHATSTCRHYDDDENGDGDDDDREEKEKRRSMIGWEDITVSMTRPKS